MHCLHCAVVRSAHSSREARAHCGGFLQSVKRTMGGQGFPLHPAVQLPRIHSDHHCHCCHVSCDSGFNSFNTLIFSQPWPMLCRGTKEVATGGTVFETVVGAAGTDKPRCLFGVWRCYPGGDLQSRPSSQSRLLFSLPSCAARPPSDRYWSRINPVNNCSWAANLMHELWNKVSILFS